jgi:hypothetical protein
MIQSFGLRTWRMSARGRSRRGLENNIVTWMEWLQTGLGLVTGFIEHLQNVTTRNYSTVANSQSLQFTTPRTQSSQSALSSRVVAGDEFDQCPLLPSSRSYWLAIVPQLTPSKSSPSYFTTGSLPLVSSSWRQAPWESRPDFLFNWTLALNSPYVSSCLTRRWVCLLWICLAFRQVHISHI